MEIVQIVALALIATFFAVLLREQNPVYAMFVGTVAGVIIFLRLMGYLAGVFQFLTEVTLQANISMVYLNTLLKIMGIAYLAEFGSQICRDAGEGVIAGKVEFAGKLLILVMALPLLAAVLETILNFVP
ncbi:MAG: stage III sporulation protein AD [Dethiobacter sp.]|nr:stage III sporulation protein AD [Dethiobacter sp.]MBS3898154.1 stage III sporulation protein AD [Dethiobacter sp.]MBS3982575.1 stage III sporulation protein AD [Dethiobacter sp.]MCL4464065.1 stage III sporulation protein AD [Bacillota bacterium]MCL5993080.1 stage III sporulation protein AD [Bacillota bacterium]